MSAFALAKPTRRANVEIVPPLTNVPREISGKRNFASRATIMKSDERASSNPAPMACPLTAASTGLSQF